MWRRSLQCGLLNATLCPFCVPKCMCVCVCICMGIYVCMRGSNDVEKSQSEAPNGVWNGQSSDGSLLGMTNAVPAMCSRYPDTYTGVKNAGCWFSRPLISWPLCLLGPQTKMVGGNALKRPWRPWSWSSLISTCPLRPSLSRNMKQRQVYSAPGIGYETSMRWCQWALVLFGTLVEIEIYYLCVYLCDVCGCSSRLHDPTLLRSHRGGGGLDCGWLITNAVVSQGGDGA